MSQRQHTEAILKVVSFVDVFFFFQAEDGIRDVAVTGVQTCALPILDFDMATRGRAVRPGAWSTSNPLGASSVQHGYDGVSREGSARHRHRRPPGDTEDRKSVV